MSTPKRQRNYIVKAKIHLADYAGNCFTSTVEGVVRQSANEAIATAELEKDFGMNLKMANRCLVEFVTFEPTRKHYTGWEVTHSTRRMRH